MLEFGAKLAGRFNFVHKYLKQAVEWQQTDRLTTVTLVRMRRALIKSLSMVENSILGTNYFRGLGGGALLGCHIN
jgi:hypothetical protein